MPTPWTHAVIVGWRPELRFYEQHVPLLRELEQRDTLLAFRVADNEVQARIGTNEVLTLRPDGLTAVVAGDGLDLTAIRQAVGLVLESLQPAGVVVHQIVMQFLEPVGGVYEEARAKSTQMVVGPLMAEAKATDYALLIDGWASTLECGFQVELGVISRREAPQRVGRRAGRVQNLGVFAPLESVIMGGLEYPEVAFFSDWTWQLARELDPGTGDELFTIWDAATAHSAKMVDSLQVVAGLDDGYQNIVEAQQ